MSLQALSQTELAHIGGAAPELVSQFLSTHTPSDHIGMHVNARMTVVDHIMSMISGHFS
jgi:hypothetical protein